MKNEGKQPQITEYLYRKACLKNIPLSGTFELTPRCNLNCKMCYVRMTKQEIENSGYKEKTLDEWLELAKQCKEEGMLFLLITGGEPFLLKDFRVLYEELCKMGFIIKINSNGTMIDEDTVEWLKQNPPAKINLTIYGASNETYNRLCNNPNGFDQAKNAVKLLKEANIPLKVNMTLTEYNKNDIEEIYRFAKENDIEVHTTSYIFPPARKFEDKFGMGDRMSAKEAANYELYGEQLKLSEEGYLQKAHIINREVEKMKNHPKREGRLPIACRAGKCSFWINWKGEMTPCGMMNHPKSYPFDLGFKNAWQEIVEKTKEIFLPEPCTTCKFKPMCHVCPASTYTETGDYSKKPEYICEMTECEYEGLMKIIK